MKKFLLFLFFAIFTLNIFSEELKLKGISPGMTRSAIAAIMPTIKTDESLSQQTLGIEVASSHDPRNMPSDIKLTFIDGILARYDGSYTEAEVAQAGGLDAILGRLETKLGPCPDITRNPPLEGVDGSVILIAFWYNKGDPICVSFDAEINRRVYTRTLSSWDNRLMDKIKERKVKSQSAGF